MDTAFVSLESSRAPAAPHVHAGRNPMQSPTQAEEAHAFIRSVLSELFGAPAADRVRIQYGGSVKPENAEDLMRQKNIDGALIGGASLDPRSFARIIQRAEAARS